MLGPTWRETNEEANKCLSLSRGRDHAMKQGRTVQLPRECCPATDYASKEVQKVKHISMCLLAICVPFFGTFGLSNNLPIYEMVFYY